MNPYEGALNGRDPAEVLPKTVARLRALTAVLGAEGLKRALAPGKWTAAQILAHIADTEIAFGFRLRQIAARPGHQIQVFDQDDWAWPYAALDAQAALDALAAARAWNLLWLAQVDDARLAHPAFHPERGPLTLHGCTGMMAGHDLHHLAQLETIASAA